ncbi:MAG: leucine--tRNA ligase [bacterium]
MEKIQEYNFREIEKKWGDTFASGKTSASKNRKKIYLLEMFPYPSGALHMGHMRNYTIGDTYKRFLEMQGSDVIYPMGFDAFGMPAENAAIKSGVHPKEWTMQNIEKMMRQQKRMGLSYQWDRLVITCREDYYRWNQWFFLKFFEKGLAYRKEAAINWCPACRTVLANEQVISGKCWRCGDSVTGKNLKQWFLKITDYAEELLKCLDGLDWPERVKSQQTNWLGKSEGVKIKFPLETGGEIDVFTTRPDTLWGATFMAVSPHHPLLSKIGAAQKKEIEELKAQAVLQSDEEKEKFGVELPARAVNPVTGEKIPVFAANFVLMEYGTGAIMCVPAHDKRDFAFAGKYKLPVKAVITPVGEKLDGKKMREAFVGDGILAESGVFSGMPSDAAKKKIALFLEEKGSGKTEIRWHLRDWLVSRQRYWGTPIPIVYCPGCGEVPVPENTLPVVLPENVSFDKKGNPLKNIPEFVNVRCPKCGGEAKRETDTLDTFFDSSWYFLRYLDSKNGMKPFEPEIINKYMPVDQYIGGIEHATMHLIYARFFIKVLRDIGLLAFDEPFKKLLCQGMVIKDGAKMSKSKGNVVSVDEILNEYGADTARLFILFASPPERDLEWSAEGVRGCDRFLRKVWKLSRDAQGVAEEKELPANEKEELDFITAKTVSTVGNDLTNFEFNTAISAIQEFVNFIMCLKNKRSRFRGFRDAMVTVIKLLYPFAPFITSELGGEFKISFEKFPEFSEKTIAGHAKEIVIQVNGKLRGKVLMESGAKEAEVLAEALKIDSVKKIAGGGIKKKIYIAGRLLNIVTGGKK